MHKGGRLRQLASGVAMNWAATVAAILSTFILSPFVVRRLGDTGYGVWVLVTSTIAYLGLLDLGLRGAVIHFVARHHATGEHDLASQSFSTAFQVRLAMTGVALVATAILAAFIDRFFQIPGGFVSAARWSAVAVGMGLAATLSCGIFGAVLAALNRFDLLSGITLIQTVLYAAGTAVLLWAGQGLGPLAMWQMVTVVGSGVAQVWLARKTYPELRLRVRHRLDFPLLHKIWVFSFYIVLANLTSQVIYFSGNIVAGAFISASAVTIYSIAVRLLEYHRTIVASLWQVFLPVASGMHAQKDKEGVHTLLIQGTRAAVLLSWPVLTTLLFRGGSFVGLWMGPEYGPPSHAVLRILIVSHYALVTNGVAYNIVFGMGRHKAVPLWQAVEAVINVSLTTWFAHGLGWGLNGIALGVMLPNFVSCAIIWPIYITRTVEYPLGRYLIQTWLRPALAVLPFAAACAWVERFWPAQRMDVFFLQILATLPVYVAGIAIVFRREFLYQIRTPDSLVRRRIIQPLRLRAGF